MMDGTTFTGGVAADEIRAFVERAERLNAEKQDALDAIKELYAEVKSRGYDAPTLRKVVAERKKDADKRSEAQAVFELYMGAVGFL